MIFFTTFYEDYIDRPKLTDQKPILDLIVQQMATTDIHK